MKDFEHYIELEREAYLRQKQARLFRREARRTRMELRRARIRRTYLLALGLLAVLFLALLTAPDAVSSGELQQTLQTPPPRTTGVYFASAAVPERPEPAAKKAERDEPTFSRVIENATATHYCICKKCCGKDPSHPAYGITASGREAVPGYSVAVDPTVIELGTILYIDHGDGVLREYRADDTGSAIKGAKIDICVEDHATAIEMGVKTVAVYLAEE